MAPFYYRNGCCDAVLAAYQKKALIYLLTSVNSISSFAPWPRVTLHSFGSYRFLSKLPVICKRFITKRCVTDTEKLLLLIYPFRSLLASVKNSFLSLSVHLSVKMQLNVRSSVCLSSAAAAALLKAT